MESNNIIMIIIKMVVTVFTATIVIMISALKIIVTTIKK
jgi:hypothetical protein